MFSWQATHTVVINERTVSRDCGQAGAGPESVTEAGGAKEVCLSVQAGLCQASHLEVVIVDAVVV